MRFPGHLLGDGVFADAYAPITTYTPVISGGVLFSGTALITPVIGQYSFIGVGGVNFSGNAQTSQGYEPVISGSVSFSGSAGISIVANTVSSGGVLFSGDAAISVTNSIPGEGGINFTPAHDLLITRNVLPSNGVLFSGSAITEQTLEYAYSPPSEGGVLFSGDDGTTFIPTPLSTFSQIGSGGLALSGSGAIIVSFNVIGSGSLKFSGDGETDNPTDHQNSEVVEFTLTLKRSEELEMIIDREFEADVQITRSIDLTHVL